jgi:predicted AAA+ superfamily ATPase
MRWWQNFIRTYLERDIPQFGPRIAAETLRRFWTMLAHQQGGLLNVAQLARNLSVDAKTAQGYIDLLCDLLLVRRLPPWHVNLGKRLVKSPKVFVRDSGLVHALLDIETKEAVLSHPVVGASWESMCIENLLACAPANAQAYFYRTSGGAEIDLLLHWPDNDLWAIEIKRSLTPKVERGFHAACEDLQPARKLVVYPGDEPFPLGHGVQAIPLAALCRELALKAPA